MPKISQKCVKLKLFKIKKAISSNADNNIREGNCLRAALLIAIGGGIS